MDILKADQNDLTEILKLQYLAYQSEARLINNFNIPPLRQTLDEVTQEYLGGTVLKAVDANGSIVGSVRAYSSGGTLYIGKLIVRPDLQGQGIGTRLLSEIESTSPHMRYELFTGSKSISNISFYQKRSYTIYAEKAVSPDLTLVYMEKYHK